MSSVHPGCHAARAAVHHQHQLCRCRQARGHPAACQPSTKRTARGRLKPSPDLFPGHPFDGSTHIHLKLPVRDAPLPSRGCTPTRRQVHLRGPLGTDPGHVRRHQKGLPQLPLPRAHRHRPQMAAGAGGTRGWHHARRRAVSTALQDRTAGTCPWMAMTRTSDSELHPHGDGWCLSVGGLVKRCEWVKAPPLPLSDCRTAGASGGQRAEGRSVGEA